MRSLFLVFVLLGVAASSAAELPSVCEQCKSMVQTFVDASTDQVKMSKLKVSMTMMCSGTSHEEDCFKTLNHFDFISRKMSKYLKNTEAVCTRLQMCSTSENSEIAPIVSELSRVVMLFIRKSQADVSNDNLMKREICEECKIVSATVAQRIGTPQTLIATTSFLNQYLCQAAGSYKDVCNEFTISILPNMLAGVGELFRDHNGLCGDVQLCENSKAKFLAPEKPEKSASAFEIWKSMGRGEELMSCFECTLAVDTLIEEFLSKRQTTADDLQTTICGKVVEDWDAGCNDFLHMYLSTVLYLTYNQFDGRAVCDQMHTCKEKKDFAQLATFQQSPEKCALFQMFLAENAPRFQPFAAQSIIENVCQQLPVTFNSLCIRSVHHLTSRFLDQIAMVATDGRICAKI